MDAILNLLNSYSVILFIATLMIIAFAKCITKIFRMGTTFKADLVTRTEQRQFEEEIRRDMRAYAIQIQKSVSDSLMIVLNNKLSDIEDAKKAADDIRVIKANLDLQIKNLSEKADNAKAVADEVRAMSTRVQRLEYQQATNSIVGKTDRRSEN